jgi:uncharacterized protein (UPF0333 family)
MRIINHKGQSTLEYAILIIIIIAALVSLQTYIKRGVQGRLKSSTDDIGEGYSQAVGAKYNHTVKTVSNTHEEQVAGVSNTTIQKDGTIQTNTTSTIAINADGEYWFNSGAGNGTGGGTTPTQTPTGCAQYVDPDTCSANGCSWNGFANTCS